jgi:FkbM family methyltransferase
MPRSLHALDSVHRLLSRSSLLTRAAILLRNQCRAVIKYRLMTTHQVDQSGEAWFLARVAPLCRTVVDVGANRGEWSALVLRHGKNIERCLAFEPGKRAAALLRERFASAPQVEIIERALSDHAETSARFFEQPEAGETSSLSRPPDGEAAVETTVEVSTLDLEMQRLQLERIDLLKVDAEGHDLAVLRGARQILQEGRARFIQWEYSDVWIPGGGTLAAALGFLRELGYRSFLLKRGGLYHFDYDRFGEFFTFSNFVSLREDDVAAFAGDARPLL